MGKGVKEDAWVHSRPHLTKPITKNGFRTPKYCAPVGLRKIFVRVRVPALEMVYSSQQPAQPTSRNTEQKKNESRRAYRAYKFHTDTTNTTHNTYLV